MAELKGMRSDLVIDVCDLRKVEWVSHGLGRWGGSGKAWDVGQAPSVVLRNMRGLLES